MDAAFPRASPWAEIGRAVGADGGTRKKTPAPAGRRALVGGDRRCHPRLISSIPSGMGRGASAAVCSTGVLVGGCKRASRPGVRPGGETPPEPAAGTAALRDQDSSQHHLARRRRRSAPFGRVSPLGNPISPRRGRRLPLGNPISPRRGRRSPRRNALWFGCECGWLARLRRPAARGAIQGLGNSGWPRRNPRSEPGMGAQKSVY